MRARDRPRRRAGTILLAASLWACAGAGRAIAAPAVESLRVHAGTGVTLRLEARLGSARSHAGQRFHARVVEPVRVGRRIVIPARTLVTGHVLLADAADTPGESGRLRLQYDELRIGHDRYDLSTRGMLYEWEPRRTYAHERPAAPGRDVDLARGTLVRVRLDRGLTLPAGAAK